MGDAFHDLKTRLDDIEALPPNWDGRQSPSVSKLSINHARKILDIAYACGLLPECMNPTSENSVVLLFLGKGNGIDFLFECNEKGEILFLLKGLGKKIARNVQLEEIEIILSSIRDKKDELL